MEKLKNISVVLLLLGALLLNVYFADGSMYQVSDASVSVTETEAEAPDAAEAATDVPSGRVIVFEDPVIEGAVRSILQKPSGDITEDELLKITSLGDSDGADVMYCSVEGKKINTLSDLKWMKNLKTLTLRDCKIKSLDGIEGLDHLEMLCLRKNKITDLAPLKSLTNLRELDLSENNISDISALLALVNLERLSLGDCDEINLSAIKDMSKLKELYASRSNISDISVLADKTDLEYLQLSSNEITDISALKSLNELRNLMLGSNQITDISPLDELLNLETVDLNDNPLSQECVEEFYAPKKRDLFTREFRGKRNTDMPEFIFRLTAYKSKDIGGGYKTIEIAVIDAKSGDTIQELLPSDYTMCGDYVSCPDENLGFIIEDMNFDGYQDFRIMEFLAPNIPYLCWIWDEESGRYVYDVALSDITSLEVDGEKELITAFGRDSAAEHFNVYYKYIDGVLTLIKEIRSGFLDDSDPWQGYEMTWELVDGQWVVTDKHKIEIEI